MDNTAAHEFPHTVWADSAFGGGDGSAKNPYIISTSDQWDLLGTDVAAGTNYSGKYFRLDEDISVTTMLGTGTSGNDAKPFKGTFDGNGHTLTFNKTNDDDDVAVAPFRFVTSATIKNLHVDGTITTSKRHVGGLVGRAYGTTLIQGCRVSTVIKSSVSGDGTHGGIVSIKPDWTNAHLTIDACVFDGKIVSTGTVGGDLQSPTTHCGGFVGYTSYGSLTITNSIYAPATPADGETAIDSEKTFYRSPAKGAGTITMANCYYIQTMGEAQGKVPHGIAIQTPGITIVPTGNATYHSTTGITTYKDNQCMKYNDIIFAGVGDQPKLTFAHNYEANVSYSVDSPATLEGNNTDGYTLTMPDADVTIKVTGVTAEGIEGDGSVSNPYKISNATKWDIIACHVNSGDDNYPSAYYQLTSDIAVTTMMGNSDHRFRGHFDGQGKTLTVNYDTGEEYAAPFRFVEGAVIHDLKVDGTITTSKKFAAGLIANAANGATITNCRVNTILSSSLNGDGTHGGFVANIQGGTTTITRCAFDGSFQGSNTNNCGGFVGWTESDNSAAVKFSNCLFAPTSLTIRKSGCATFSRGRNNSTANITINGGYYISTLGAVQGTQAYASDAGDRPYALQTIVGVNYYLPVETLVSDVKATDITPNAATLSWEGSEGCSYKVRYRKAGVSYFTDFEQGLPEGWTTIDADGDGYDWYDYDDEDKPLYHSAKTCLASASYNDKALTPDNWLVTKQLDLGGTLRVWIGASDNYDCQEHFAIYLSTTGEFVDDSGNPKEGLITLLPETETTYGYKEYTADLSAYAGQEGYIAIRHFNTSDQFILVLDDFGIYAGTVVETTASPFTITGLKPDTEYEVEVQAVYDDKTSDWSSVATFTTANAESIGLADNADNTQVITDNADKTCNVTLAGRTLYKDGNWNTLCLPFDFDLAADEAFAGAELMTLSASYFNAGELTLTFEKAESIEAGVPYIVWWTEGSNIVNPVFNGVTISSTAAATETASSSYVDFVGTYSPVNIYTEEKTNLYLGAGNTLYYPLNANFNVNACRAYFTLKSGLVAGEPAGGVRAFVLNFGEGSDTNGIIAAEADSSLFTLHIPSGTRSTASASTSSPPRRASTSGTAAKW